MFWNFWIFDMIFLFYLASRWRVALQLFYLISGLIPLVFSMDASSSVHFTPVLNFFSLISSFWGNFFVLILLFSQHIKLITHYRPCLINNLLFVVHFPSINIRCRRILDLLISLSYSKFFPFFRVLHSSLSNPSL